jgi:hypothetical protein
MPPDAAIGGIPNLARTDWLGLQRVYDWVLALPLDPVRDKQDVCRTELR